MLAPWFGPKTEGPIALPGVHCLLFIRDAEVSLRSGALAAHGWRRSKSPASTISKASRFLRGPAGGKGYVGGALTEGATTGVRSD